MASKFARLLLATLVGIALGAVAACEQSGPIEQTEAEIEGAAEGTGAVAAPAGEDEGGME
jgi:hypothetical protein